MSADGWDVVLIGGTRFGGDPPLGDWQLARALARRRRLLYVDPPTPAHRASPALVSAALRGDSERVAEGLRVFRPVGLPRGNHPRMSAATNAAVARQVGRVCQRVLGDDVVLVSFDPKRGPLPAVPVALRTYWIRDRLARSANTRYPDHLLRLHAEVLRAADVVTAVSEPLLAEAAELTGALTAVVHNGCDYDHFAKTAPRGHDKPSRPVIGFIGGVSWRLDLDLIEAVARSRPDYRFRFVGRTELALPSLANLTCVGPVPYASLPGEVARFAVGMIPYRVDGFNAVSFPLKAFEYLAAGVPVVSTPIPPMRGLEPFVRTAATPEAFVEAIDAALRDGPPPADCRAVARGNSWDARAAELDELVGRALSGRDARTAP